VSAEGWDAKQRIVAEAEQLTGSAEWKRTGERYRELKEALGSAGSVGRAADRDFERRFASARQRFYDNRASARITAKMDLVERARNLVSHKDARAAKEQFKSMDREWRALDRGGAEEEKWRAEFKSAGDAIWQADLLSRRKRLEERIERLRDQLWRAESSYADKFASGVDYDRRVANMKPGPRKSAGEDRVWEINQDLNRRGERIAQLKREVGTAQQRLRELR
jgi:hypothetical protein